MSTPDLIKVKDKYKDASVSYRLKRARSYARLAVSNAAFLARLAMGRARPAPLFEPHDLDPSFFGANCPPSPTEEMENLMFAALTDLGLKTVRVDWGPESDAAMVSRWLDRLIDGGFEVLLHLVQPAAEAARMDCAAARESWKGFIAPIFERYAGRAGWFEIGSTPNRHSWSGYTIGDYAAACSIAQEIADRHGARIIGPNVSDFAPYFTVPLLAACRRAGVRFDAMSDNLFVDRAGSPETYDSSVLGRPLRNVGKFDLAGKSAVLARVAHGYGIERVFCTYTYYTLDMRSGGRPSRKRQQRYLTPESYADHLVRYFVYSAAAGALDRVYWGNLAGHFKGVLNDGYVHRPDPPTVHHKFYNYGDVTNYERRPGFAAFQNVVKQLQGARFVESISRRDPFVFRFERNGESIVVAWSAKEGGEESAAVDALIEGGARVVSRDGEPLDLETPVKLSGSPIYLANGKE
jgi:hypothetical protein